MLARGKSVRNLQNKLRFNLSDIPFPLFFFFFSIGFVVPFTVNLVILNLSIMDIHLFNFVKLEYKVCSL